MEETLNPTVDTVVEESNSQTEEKADTPMTPQEQLNALINRRMGQFDVKINYADLKYIKNSINSKVEWKGPNEAYLVVMALLTLDAALESMDPKKAEAEQIKLPASTIETINFFFTRITGKGIESAQKLFSITMQLRQPVETIKKLDQEIEVLQSELKTEKNSDSVK
jgi:hypothetical protein